MTVSRHIAVVVASWAALTLVNGAARADAPAASAPAAACPDESADASDAEAAIAFCTHVVDSKPADAKTLARALTARGNAYNQLDKNDEALSDANSALSADPTDVYALVLRGNLRGALGQHDAAFADFNAALALDPRNGVALVARGGAWHYFKHEDAEARKDFEAAIQAGSNLYFAYFALGRLDMDEARYDDALKDFDNAAAHNTGGQGNIARARGVIYESMGRGDEAMKTYSAAIQADPTDAPTYVFRAGLLVERHDYAAAIKDCDTAIGLKPDYARAFAVPIMRRAPIRRPCAISIQPCASTPSTPTP
jgi:tetratricopeptide (TPR) repeat protein